MAFSGTHLRALRKRVGVTGTKLAADSAISPQYLSDIERGLRVPTAEVAERLAAALDVPLSILETDSEEASA